MNFPNNSNSLCYLSIGVDVGEISSDSGRVDDIVESQMSDEFVLLEQQTQRLADSSRRAQQSHFWRRTRVANRLLQIQQIDKKKFNPLEFFNDRKI